MHWQNLYFGKGKARELKRESKHVRTKNKYYKQQQSQALSSIWPSINYGGGQTCLPTQNALLSLESDATAVGKNQFKKTVATIHTK